MWGIKTISRHWIKNKRSSCISFIKVELENTPWGAKPLPATWWSRASMGSKKKKEQNSENRLFPALGIIFQRNISLIENPKTSFFRSRHQKLNWRTFRKGGAKPLLTTWWSRALQSVKKKQGNHAFAGVILNRKKNVSSPALALLARGLCGCVLGGVAMRKKTGCSGCG